MSREVPQVTRPPTPVPPQPRPSIQHKVLSYSFLALLLLGIGVALYRMVSIFVVPVMLAAVFTALFYPFYERLLRLLGGRRATSAFLCCLVLLAALLVPAYFTAAVLAREAAGFYTLAQDQVVQFMQEDPAELRHGLARFALVRALGLDRVDWQAKILEATREAGGALAEVVTRTSRGTIQLVASLFITFFTMYYFFMDGPRLVAYLKYLSPLDERYEAALIRRFLSVARATVRGSLFIGLLQGTLGGLALWVTGFTSPLLWGGVMVILSLIPFVGSWLVLYPAAVYQMVTGHLLSGLFLLVFCTLLVSQLDNVLRPRLVGRDTGLHDLVIFFSTLGGINLFGVMGFILGPIIAAVFLTILDFYSIEFGHHLQPPATPGSGPGRAH
ncbi:MAG: AI-2E family transporter [Candidatus Latescibacterota bacterium]